MKARRVDDSRGSRVQRAALVTGTLLLVWSTASRGRAAEPFFPKVSPLSESRRQELGLPAGDAGMLLEQDFRKLSRGIVIESIVSRVVKPTEFTSQWHREVKSGQILVGYWKRQPDGTWDRETRIVGISELMGNTDTDAHRTTMERLEREYAQLTQAEQPADHGDTTEEQIRVPKFRALTDADRRRLHLGQDVTGYLLLDAVGQLDVDTVVYNEAYTDYAIDRSPEPTPSPCLIIPRICLDNLPSSRLLLGHAPRVPLQHLVPSRLVYPVCIVLRRGYTQAH